MFKRMIARDNPGLNPFQEALRGTLFLIIILMVTPIGIMEILILIINLFLSPYVLFVVSLAMSRRFAGKDLVVLSPNVTFAVYLGMRRRFVGGNLVVA